MLKLRLAYIAFRLSNLFFAFKLLYSRQRLFKRNGHLFNAQEVSRTTGLLYRRLQRIKFEAGSYDITAAVPGSMPFGT